MSFPAPDGAPAAGRPRQAPAAPGVTAIRPLKTGTKRANIAQTRAATARPAHPRFPGA
jgi:hypothetical protein